jgi:Ca-activated chloride channel family protein
MLLKNSDYKEDLTFDEILKIAKSGRGNDEFGYRSEFIKLVEMTKYY